MAMAEQVLRNEKKVSPNEAKELSLLSVKDVRRLIETSKHSVDDLIKLKKYASLPAVAKHLVLVEELCQSSESELRNVILANPFVGELKARLWRSHRKTD